MEGITIDWFMRTANANWSLALLVVLAVILWRFSKWIKDRFLDPFGGSDGILATWFAKQTATNESTVESNRALVKQMTMQTERLHSIDETLIKIEEATNDPALPHSHVQIGRLLRRLQRDQQYAGEAARELVGLIDLAVDDPTRRQRLERVQAILLHIAAKPSEQTDDN